jgi:hypothetical protein
MHLVLWLEIASILVDVQLVVCYNAGKHEVAKNFLLQTPRVIEGERHENNILHCCQESKQCFADQ